MKFRLVKLTQLSGVKASIYTIIIDGQNESIFERFILENKISFKSEIQDILVRLDTIGKKVGAREHYFKQFEGRPGDGVCALYDLPNKSLRLYCIRYGKQLIVVGGGGPKGVRKLQDDPKLKSENYLLRLISQKITERIKEREIVFTNDGLDFEGDLNFEDNE